VAHALRLTDADRLLLEFLAEHRVARANQVARLLGVSVGSAQWRLRRLGSAGYLTSDRLYADQPKHYVIKPRGLAAIGSRLSAPRMDQMNYRHDVGMAWVWLAARSGAFGELTAMHSERAMRSDDGRAAAEDAHQPARSGAGERFGIKTAGWGPHGGEQLHYPDLLLETATRHRVAVELELSGKSTRRLEKIIGRYVSERRIDAVLYLVDDDRRAKEITAAARRLGASDLIHVQRVRWSEPVGPPARAAARQRTQTRAPRSSELER
jgi:hypothetical protein